MKWLDGIADSMLEQAQRDSEVQESLVSCSPWGCNELDVT